MQEIATQLATQLGVASEKIYAKLIWYVRVNGIAELIGYSGYFLLAGYLSLKITKYFKKQNDYDVGDWLLSSVAASSVVWFALYMVYAILFDNIVKIVSPEYYIIDQAFNSLLKLPNQQK